MKRQYHMPLLALAGTLCSAVLAQETTFTITDEVIAKDPPRVGHNLVGGSFSPWSYPSHNQWVQDGFPNPFEARVKVTLFEPGRKDPGSIIESGPDFVTTRGNFAMWDNYWTGFWDGADYAVFRYEPGKKSATLLREGKIKSFTLSGEGKEKTDRVVFDKAGPEIKDGDEVVVRQKFSDIKPNTLRQKNAYNLRWGKLDGENLRIDTAEKAPEGGSLGSLWIAEGAQASQSYLGNAAEHWIKLKPGTYEMRLWAKAAKDGAKLDIDVAGIAKQGFELSTAWKAYSFSYPSAHPDRTLANLTIKPAGSAVWIDNITVHLKNSPPVKVFPEVVAEFKKFRPGVIRFWSSWANTGNLDDWIADYPGQQTPFTRGGPDHTNRPNLPEALQICQEVGTDPWFIVNVHMTPTEWRNLIEYLAGDASTPYGAKRAAAGRTEPWTKAFNKIYLECGNEVWSRIFRPQSWLDKFDKYAAYSHLMFESATAHPAFNKDKFVFVGSDWGGKVDAHAAESWGSKAAKLNDLIGATTVAHYTGGFDGYKFDESGGREAQVLNRLFYGPRLGWNRVDQHMKAVAAIRPGVQAVSYEGGPGYGLPSPGKKFNEEAEQVGKSLASAVATADIYLYAASRGYGVMAAFFFAEGDINWSSHARDWRPHAWQLALEMRNRFCEGDIVRVSSQNTPLFSLPSEEVTPDGHGGAKKVTLPELKDCPTINSYAFKRKNGYDIYIISREPKEARKVTFVLPTDVSGTAKLRSLAHPDPWANNRTEEVLRIVEKETAVQGNRVTLTVPPHSVHVLNLNSK